jgi:hypothetical protein
MTGIVTAAWISLIILGSDILATPPEYCSYFRDRVQVHAIIMTWIQRKGKRYAHRLARCITAPCETQEFGYKRTVLTNVSGDTFQGHDSTSTSLLGDLGLRGIDNVHNDTTLLLAIAILFEKKYPERTKVS